MSIEYSAVTSYYVLRITNHTLNYLVSNREGAERNWLEVFFYEMFRVFFESEARGRNPWTSLSSHSMT